MKYFNLALVLITIIAIWVIPTYAYILVILSLLLSLALSTYAIYTKHKGTEHARAKILKEVGVMVLTLVIVLFSVG